MWDSFLLILPARCCAQQSTHESQLSEVVPGVQANRSSYRGAQTNMVYLSSAACYTTRAFPPGETDKLGILASPE